MVGRESKLKNIREFYFTIEPPQELSCRMKNSNLIYAKSEFYYT